MNLNEIKLAKVKQFFPQDKIDDITAAVKQELSKIRPVDIKPGAKVAITVGSRGIKDIVTILKTACQVVRAWGGDPFLFSAMGSHGGGTEQGQKELLESFGINEESIGARISYSTDVKLLGKTDTEIPVWCAKEACEADTVLVINRVKPHTSFSAEHESGLLKMMTVGMGRVKGATMVHAMGMENAPMIIQEMLPVLKEKLSLMGGIGIVENAQGDTAAIMAAAPGDLEEIDKNLLLKAKSLTPRLPIKNLDALIIHQLGKNFSGTGIDTKVVGRLRLEGSPEFSEPTIKYIAVLDLAKESHGNAAGIGLADFTTKKLVEKIDFEKTYLNCLTSGGVIRAAIPMYFETEKRMLEAIVMAAKPKGPDSFRLMAIKNTLDLEELWVAENLLSEIEQNSNAEVVSKPEDLSWTDEESIIWK